MRVLVCGSREFADQEFLDSVLDTLHVSEKITCLIHGGATGADTMAGRWAQRRGILIEKYPANWDYYGKSAGPIRNQQMLEKGKPDLVVAFPGGRGTTNMVNLAKAAGVAILEV